MCAPKAVIHHRRHWVESERFAWPQQPEHPARGASSRRGNLGKGNALFGKCIQHRTNHRNQRSDFCSGDIIDAPMIECGVAVSEHVSEGDDERPFGNLIKSIGVQFSKLSQGIAGNLELSLDRRLAEFVGEVALQRLASHELRHALECS